MFQSIIETTLGGTSGTESLGLAPSDVAVIETDGTIEQADSIKVAYDGAPATGLDVYSHPLDAAAAHPAIRARQQGLAGLSPVCRACPVVDSCGGGLYAHRYLTGSGFANPSVYCTDLEKIITHVRARLRPQAAGTTASTAGQEGETGTAAAHRPSHSMPQAHFDALAAGFGDAESISYLSAAQRSVRRALLRLLHERASLDGDPAFDGGWELLTRLDHAAPGAVDEVLAHPYVRAWAEGCLRQARPARRQHRHPARAPGVRGGGGGHQVRHARRGGRAGHRRVRAPPHARAAPRGRREDGHARGDRSRAVRGQGHVGQVADRRGRAGPGERGGTRLAAGSRAAVGGVRGPPRGHRRATGTATSGPPRRG